MDQNRGSYGAPIGGSQALQAAMQRRKIGGSVLNAMSPGSGQQSPVPPEIDQSAPNVTPTPQQALTSPVQEIPQQPQPQGQEFRSAENEIALKALASVVKTEGKIAEHALRMQGMGTLGGQ